MANPGLSIVFIIYPVNSQRPFPEELSFDG
jgi:hypothetical protein